MNMGKHPCCPKEIINKGAWSKQEDETLSKYVAIHGGGKWQKVAQNAGLKRCGKSCRQRWLNYLKPGIKRGDISEDEEDMIIRLHRLLGNRWALIAKRIPGRTDNEIKNYWNTVLSKKLQKNPTSSWAPSASLKHNHNHKCEELKTKQIHVANEAPRPMRVTAVKNSKILENSPGSSNKIEGSGGEASLTDFLVDIDENQLLIADDSNSMLPQMEDHKSASPSDHCHLLSETNDDSLEALLDVELKWMAGFLGLENE